MLVNCYFIESELIMIVSETVQQFIDSIGNVDHDNMIVFYVNDIKVYLCECIDITC